MTLVEDGDAGATGETHLGELVLRRYRAGELAGSEAETIGQHTARCGRCRARLTALDDEQRAFERAIPFERFSGGVERAARVPTPRRTSIVRSLWALPALSALAAAAFLLVVRPRADDGAGGGAGFNHRKGAQVDAALRIAGADGKTQRALPAGASARLGRGERLRVGYQTDRPRHLVALSIDDHGVVTSLYPDSSSRSVASLLVDRAAQATFLPDSIELTGAGRERLFLLMAEGPFSVESAVAAVRASRATAGPGGLAAMSAEAAAQALDALAPRSFTWLLEKP